MPFTKTKSPQSNYTNSSRKSTVPFPLRVLQFAITLIIGAFVFANIKPYEVIASNFLSGLEYPVLGQILFSTPLIGGLFRIIAKTFSFTLGTALWAVFQILELLPLLLFGHERFLDTQISKDRNHAKYQVNNDDNWEVKVAKKLANSLSTELMRFLLCLAIGAYIIDFLLITTVYPPVEGNFGDFVYILQTSQYHKINWVNFQTSVAVLFAVEFLFKLERIIKQIIRDLSR